MTVIATDLAALLGTVRRPGDFYVAGEIAFSPPSLDVASVGPVALPLLPIQARQLIDAAEPAPFGRGEQTIIDPTVRRCGQIGPDRVRLGGRHWARTLEDILARVSDGLGVDEPIDAEFYKLLIYDQGGFFVSHRDTEKVAGMFATLTVVLPSHFSGGDLIIRHKGREACLALHTGDPGDVAFAAFYADCVHEILPVSEGCRLALIYNLLRRSRSGRGRALHPPDYTAEQARIAALLRRWTDTAGPDAALPAKLVYPLEHAYTPAELGFASLKGADAAVGGVLTGAARDAGCDLHLALLTIEESGAAEYADTYGSRRGRWDTADAFEAGEVFERSVALSDWRRPDGTRSDLGEIPVEEDEIAPPGACDDLAPDEEQFHEATGNEGASFERSYRRAALVLWPRARLFAVLSQAGLGATLPYLGDLVRRWAAADPDCRAALWRDAHDLAEHMVGRWPKHDWRDTERKEPSEAGQILGLLAELGDTATIETVLTGIIAGGFGKADTDAIMAALGQLAPLRRVALIELIVAESAAGSLGACANLLARAAVAWATSGNCDLTGAATRLLTALPSGAARATPSSGWQQSGRAVVAGVVADLVLGFGAIDPVLAERAIDHVLAWPKVYGMDAVLVPAARCLCQRQLVRGTAALARLRTACLAHLRRRMAEKLAGPTDWRRDSKIPCRCPRCADLARFLANPDASTWVLKAAEAERAHVQHSIRQAGSDVDTTTDRSGRPYRLVCTKNQASHERRLRQRQRDLEAVAELTA